MTAGSRVPPGFATPPLLETIDVLGSDGVRRRAVLVLPGNLTEPAPVLLCPHPFGYDPVMNLFGHHEGERTLADLPGVWGTASRHGLAVLCVQSEGRRYTGASLGWRPHLVRHGLPLAPNRLVAAGLSMGGMEALLLGAVLGTRVRAIAVQNAVVDLASWAEDIAQVAGFEHVPEVIRAEVGSTDQAELLSRSPVTHLDRLRGTPIQVRYSSKDVLVPAGSQSMRLAGGSDLWSFVDETPPPIPGTNHGWLSHEHVNWDALVDFVVAAMSPTDVAPGTPGRTEPPGGIDS